jgi:hypothetical protein
MKREPHQRHQRRDKLAVSISTVEACVGAASPPIQLFHDETTSLALRGELLPPRKTKRYIVVTVRRCDPGTQVCGQVFPKGRALNAWINLPPVFFTDALTLALSGGLRLLELTTEKLRRNAGEILAARFVTRDLRSHDRGGCNGSGNAIRENPAIGGR